MSWAARTEQPGGKTSPEELLAAAHASCFAMALSAQLGEAKITPESIQAKATVTLEKLADGWAVTKSHLDVLAGVDKAIALGLSPFIVATVAKVALGLATMPLAWRFAKRN